MKISTTLPQPGKLLVLGDKTDVKKDFSANFGDPKSSTDQFNVKILEYIAKLIRHESSAELRWSSGSFCQK